VTVLKTIPWSLPRTVMKWSHQANDIVAFEFKQYRAHKNTKRVVLTFDL